MSGNCPNSRILGHFVRNHSRKTWCSNGVCGDLCIGGEATLLARRVESGAAGSTQEATVSIGVAEVEELWHIVEANGLTELHPTHQPRAKGAADFGFRRLEIRWLDLENAEPRSLQIQWELPLAEGPRIEPLLRRLGDLSRSKIENPEIFFFRSPGR